MGAGTVDIGGIEWRAPQDGPGHRFTARVVSGPLAVGARRSVAVVVDAFGPGSPVESALAVQVVGFSPGDERSPAITVTASVSTSGLLVEPNPLTVGPVPFTRTGENTLRIINLRSTPTTVLAPNRADGRAQYDEIVGRGQFGALPEVDPVGALGALEPRGSMDVTLTYTAPRNPGGR